MSFDKLEAIIKARTRPWNASAAIFSVGPRRVGNSCGPTYEIDADKHVPADVAFIAAMGTLADLMLDVVKAADRLTDNIAEFDTVTDSIFVERLDDALAALQAAQEKLP